MTQLIPDNILLMTDSYKVSHHKFYPQGIQKVSSYLEAREGNVAFPYTIFFGLQYYLKRLEGVQVTTEKIAEAESLFQAHFGRSDVFNRAGWEYIRDTHGGKLPVTIRAVPEGLKTPIGIVLMTIENTDPHCAWLVNYLETFLMKVWYPITVATQSHFIRGKILENLQVTGDVTGINFKTHDFGYRGTSSEETACLGGAAHLVSFMGTDTFGAIQLLRKVYGADMPGFSIPATEHSIICSFGGEENEIEAFTHVLKSYPEGLLACVSDTFNIYRACETFGTTLKALVMGRNGTLVVRPDCYDEQTEILTNKGWKFFKDLLEDDLVAQFTQERVIEFVKPSKYITQDYEGEMIHFYSEKGRLDCLVTPNHRVVYEKFGELKVGEAKDSNFHFGRNMIRSGRKVTGTKQHLTEYERLLIAFQADGSFPSGYEGNLGKDGTLTIRFNFAKKRKFERLEAICKRGGFEYSVKREPARPENFVVYIKLNQIPSKTFDWVNIEEITDTWGREFIEELSYWDATRRSDTRYKYDTTVPLNAEKIQMVAVLCGMGCSYSIFKDDRKEIFSDVHSLSILTENNEIGGLSVQKKTVQYKGKVYCVTVPSGMLLVRRNRKTLISGNSGDPQEVIPKCLDILWKHFGGTVNEKGYKVLDSHVRLIQGDGMDKDSIPALYERLKELGWSGDNLAVGSGGGLLQKMNRDTLRFAIKASAVLVNGEWRDVQKNPITDTSKKSKAGRWSTFKRGDEIVSAPVTLTRPGFEDIMATVFEDGVVLKTYDLQEIKKNAGTN